LIFSSGPDYFRKSSLLVLFCCRPRIDGADALERDWPRGGDARAFSAVPGQPHHLYLGTTNSWLYESLDGGASWHRLSKLDSPDDLILDHIVVDAANPSTVYVAAWKLDQPGGGLWVSHDGGAELERGRGLRGQSIRAFAQAPSNPAMLFAGTLEGFSAARMPASPGRRSVRRGSGEIHEVESLAIDPNGPRCGLRGHMASAVEDLDGG